MKKENELHEIFEDIFQDFIYPKTDKKNVYIKPGVDVEEISIDPELDKECMKRRVIFDEAVSNMYSNVMGKSLTQGLGDVWAKSFMEQYTKRLRNKMFN